MEYMQIWTYHHEYIPTCVYNFTPLLYSKTGVYKGIHYFFLFLLETIDFRYSLEPPRRGGSKCNEYPQFMFWAEIWKLIIRILSENFQF